MRKSDYAKNILVEIQVFPPIGVLVSEPVYPTSEQRLTEERNAEEEPSQMGYYFGSGIRSHEHEGDEWCRQAKFRKPHWERRGR